MEQFIMDKIISSEVQRKINTAISHINEDHDTLFANLEKLRHIALHPESHLYAINILENFISLFLEHVMKEEQLLRQYLPVKIVEQHIKLHQSELTLLDENLARLKRELSLYNIKQVVTQLNQEFQKHVNQCDTEILKRLQ
jgi:hypothetical protein